MQITISQTDGTLPFIDKFPGFGIGQLEGYNGVGKSLTVSILQICAGTRPTMELQAWRGLCDGMGRLTVTASELRDVREIEWVLDGQILWQASGELDLAARPQLDWFVSVRLSDEPAASLDDVRRLFAVERVNGDIGLVEELAGRAEAAVRELESFRVHLESSDKLERAERDIAELLGAIDEVSVDRVADRAALAARRRAEREAAQEVLRKAVDRRERLEDAVGLRSRLNEIAVGGAELDAQIAELDTQIRPLSNERAETSRQLAQAEAAAAQSDDLRNELVKATRSYRRASSRLTKATGDLAKVSQIAGINDDEKTAARRVALDAELKVLHRHRVEVDAGPAVLALIDRINAPVSQAAAAGLADLALLSAPARAPSAWTVADVADALGRRRDELRELPRPRDAQRIDEQISTVSAQLSALRNVEHLRHERERAAELQNAAQERSQELSERLDKFTSERLERLRTARRDLDDQLSDLGGRRTVLVYRRDALVS